MAVSQGYALVEAFETDGDAVKDAAALAHLEELAVELDAVALIHSGTVDMTAARAVADRARLVLVEA